jgi:hypothetical protein
MGEQSLICLVLTGVPSWRSPCANSFRHMSPYLRAPPSGSVPIPPEETLSQVIRSNRYARYEAVRALHQQLVSQREIARNLSLSRNTVRKFLQAETFPERSRPPYRGSILDPYKPYILERVARPDAGTARSSWKKSKNSAISVQTRCFAIS